MTRQFPPITRTVSVITRIRENIKKRTGQSEIKNRLNRLPNLPYRLIAILISLLSLSLLPWLHLNGNTGPSTAAQIMAAAITDPARTVLFQENLLASIAAFTIPVMITLAAVFTFLKAIRNRPSVGAHLLAGLLPSVMLYTTAGITANSGLKLPGSAPIEAGPVLFTGIHLVIAGYSFLQEE